MAENGFTIVVGVDRAASSTALLRWARDFALCRHGRIRAILAWQPPEFANLIPFRVEVSMVRSAEERLAKLVAANTLGVPVESAVLEGSPAPVLLRAAADADLLVIGRQVDREPRAGTSVAARCAAECPCPLVIVPVSVVGEAR